ncbi:MAG: DUF1987 domain-containing protein [Bacteroidales bacterium]|nr:DUF1987 domain-containing protein [Bacteroidales bacterium]
MNILSIESTKFTPKVLMDPENNVFQISGFSLPENVTDFYAPVLKWLDEYLDAARSLINNKNFHFVIRLVYYNSGSFKAIIMILNKIVELQYKASR